MDRDGVAAGTVVAAVGAVALLVGLFLDWYSAGFGDGASAWTVFEIVDLLLALLAVGVLLAVVSAAAPGARIPALPSATVAVAGIAALVLVVTSLVNDPPAATGADLEEGIWISFGGAVLIVVGALLERSRIRLVVTPRDGRPAVDDEPGEPYEAGRPETTQTQEFPRP
jgi:peptidoglycan/LPS O-acetylase OafA/YrhL